MIVYIRTTNQASCCITLIQHLLEADTGHLYYSLEFIASISQLNGGHRCSLYYNFVVGRQVPDLLHQLDQLII